VLGNGNRQHARIGLRLQLLVQHPWRGNRSGGGLFLTGISMHHSGLQYQAWQQGQGCP
jgi:hypothetical protein